MSSENSTPSSKSKPNGSSEPIGRGQGSNQGRDPNFRPPQVERERKPSRQDLGDIENLISGKPVERRRGPLDDEDSNIPPRKDRAEERPPGRDEESPRNQRRDPDDQDGRSDSSRDEEDRPFLELDEDEDGKPLKKQKRSKSVEDFAREHELSIKEVYELTVPSSDGSESFSIGSMKDRIAEMRNFEWDRDQFSDYRESAMSEIVQARTTIDGVLQQLRNVVEPQVLARAFTESVERYNGQVARAKADLREYFPEWDNDEVKQADKKKLTAALSSYGFSADEVNNVIDARLIRFAMHAVRLMDRYKRAKEHYEREKNPSKSGPSRRSQPTPNRQQAAAEMAKSGDKVGAVAKLLG